MVLMRGCLGGSLLAAQITRCSKVASLSSCESLPPSAPWYRLKQSLEFELKKGCKDYKGRRQTFSAYVQKTIKELNPPIAIQPECLGLATTYDSYSSLSGPERRDLIFSSLDWISKWSAIVENEVSATEAEPQVAGTRDAMIPAGASGTVAGGNMEEKDMNARFVEVSFNILKGPKNRPEERRKGGRPIQVLAGDCHRMFEESSSRTASMYHEEWASAQVADQGSDLWLESRKARLTASSFGKVFGLLDRFDDTVVDLWEEKVGLAKPFEGNMRTRWGSIMESTALKDYLRFTSCDVTTHGLKLLREDHAHSWMAGSPDGIIKETGSIKDMLSIGQGNGILEIKCPYGKHPSKVAPAAAVQDYYYPQVQGLMDIFDIEWCHFMSWTQNNGINVFYIPRNQMYWTSAYKLLSEFWWANVVPARLAMEHGTKDIYSYAPSRYDSRRTEIAKLTKELVSDITPVLFRVN